MQIPYGESHIELDLDSVNATVVEPRFIGGLADEQSGFQAACSSPIGSPPCLRLYSPRIDWRCAFRMPLAHSRATECCHGYSSTCRTFRMKTW